MKSIIGLVFFGFAAISCTQQASQDRKSETKVSDSQSADLSTEQKVYFGYDESSAVVYKGASEKSCESVKCPALEPPSFDVDLFRIACEADGHKLVKINCCSHTYCTGLPTEKEEEIAGLPDDVIGSEPKEGNPESIGKLVYRSFNEADAKEYTGFNSSKCAAVKCPYVESEELVQKKFESACTDQGFKVIKTSCCGQDSCSGLPKEK